MDAIHKRDISTFNAFGRALDLAQEGQLSAGGMAKAASAMVAVISLGGMDRWAACIEVAAWLRGFSPAEAA